MTVGSGFTLPAAELRKLAKELKRGFGTGGTSSADAVELQGDYRDALVAELTKRRFEAVAAGG